MTANGPNGHPYNGHVNPDLASGLAQLLRTTEEMARDSASYWDMRLRLLMEVANLALDLAEADARLEIGSDGLRARIDRIAQVGRVAGPGTGYPLQEEQPALQNGPQYPQYSQHPHPQHAQVQYPVQPYGFREVLDRAGQDHSHAPRPEPAGYPPRPPNGLPHRP